MKWLDALINEVMNDRHEQVTFSEPVNAGPKNDVLNYCCIYVRNLSKC